MKLHELLGLGVAAAMAVPTFAWAQSGEDITAAFVSADKDANGYVDVNEYVGHSVAGFAELDSNRDEHLYPADVPDVDAATFAMVDRDGDGRVSLGEAIADRMIVFFKADVNRDGVLSLQEVLDAEDQFKN